MLSLLSFALSFLMRKCRTFVGKPFQDIKRLIFMIWLLNSEALEKILEARNLRAERFETRKVGALAGMSVFAEKINTILSNF